jgi:hypothetical protein
MGAEIILYLFLTQFENNIKNASLLSVSPLRVGQLSGGSRTYTFSLQHL